MGIEPKLNADAAKHAMAEKDPKYAPQEALVEAERCLYCFDAPCIMSCPTGIDIPSFIKKIADGNLTGSARTILESNVLGASCARVCPTEVLCEGACVMMLSEALLEDVLFDDEGRVRNPSLHDYLIATAGDAPEMDSTIVPSYEPAGPYGGKECGEGSTLPVIGAIANAVSDAIGVRVTETGCFQPLQSLLGLTMATGH